MGGPSGPLPFARIAAIRDKSIGPEGHPTKSREATAAGRRRASQPRSGRSSSTATASSSGLVSATGAGVCAGTSAGVAMVWVATGAATRSGAAIILARRQPPQR
ncbi:DUF6053 domain-containing protein [Lysobacter enzymogenes]|uniref:DUF6053 domain-containing protein n=1 Tax=Lysobacter enzymogenes TaxID=69 RepID=UPI003D18DBD2